MQAYHTICVSRNYGIPYGDPHARANASRPTCVSLATSNTGAHAAGRNSAIPLSATISPAIESDSRLLPLIQMLLETDNRVLDRGNAAELVRRVLHRVIFQLQQT